MTSRREFLKMLAAVPFALPLVGCAGQGGSAVAPAAPAPGTTPAAGSAPAAASGAPAGGTPVTLTAVQWGQDAEIAAIRAILDKFNVSQSRIRVEFSQMPKDDYYTQLETRIAGGQAPDLFKAVFSYFGRYAEAGAALQLDPYLPVDMKDQFNDVVWQAGVYKGKTYGVPTNLDGLLILYNVDYFKKSGLPMPPKLPAKIEECWTHDQFIDIATKVQKANGSKYAFTSYARHPRTWLLLLHQFGGSLMNAEQTKSTMNTPEGIKAISWIVDTFQKGLTPPGSLWSKPDDSDQLFSQGVTTMSISGNWMMPFLDQNMKDFKYDVTYLPKGINMATDLGGGGWMASGKTKYPKEAAEVLQYIANEDSISKYCRDNFGVPPRKKLAEAGVGYPSHDAELKMYGEQYKTLPLIHVQTTANPKYPALEQINKEELEFAIRGKKSPQEAAAAIEQRTNEALKS